MAARICPAFRENSPKPRRPLNRKRFQCAQPRLWQDRPPWRHGCRSSRVHRRSPGPSSKYCRKGPRHRRLMPWPRSSVPSAPRPRNWPSSGSRPPSCVLKRPAARRLRLFPLPRRLRPRSQNSLLPTTIESRISAERPVPFRRAARRRDPSRNNRSFHRPGPRWAGSLAFRQAHPPASNPSTGHSHRGATPLQPMSRRRRWHSPSGALTVPCRSLKPVSRACRHRVSVPRPIAGARKTISAMRAPDMRLPIAPCNGPVHCAPRPMTMTTAMKSSRMRRLRGRPAGQRQ